MRAVFRVDVNSTTGAGHIVRCLVLAEKLKPFFSEVCFCGNISHKFYCELIQASGFSLMSYQHGRSDAEADANAFIGLVGEDEISPAVIIVDSYKLDRHWERIVRDHFNCKIMVIDDLADRYHDCDIILDQNFYLAGNRYSELVSSDCVQLIGPRYTLLREEFYRSFDPDMVAVKAKDVVVCFGGADVKGDTLRSVQALAKLPDIQTAIVIVGSMATDLNLIEKECADNGFELYVQTSKMPELLLSAKFALIACGSIVWEAGVLGVPSVLTTSEPFQEPLAHDLDKAGLAINIGAIGRLSNEDLVQRISGVLSDANTLQNCGVALQNLMLDGGVQGSVHVAREVVKVAHQGMNNVS